MRRAGRVLGSRRNHARTAEGATLMRHQSRRRQRRPRRFLTTQWQSLPWLASQWASSL